MFENSLLIIVTAVIRIMVNYPPLDNNADHNANTPMPNNHFPLRNDGSFQHQDFSNCQHNEFHRQPLHHQSQIDRENIGWNRDNVSCGALANNMNSKRHNQYSHDKHLNNYYNNGPPNSQRFDSYSCQSGVGGNRDSNSNNYVMKRAAKRRVKHDLPGPAGNWFRQKKQQKSAATANRKGSKTVNTSVMAAEQGAKQQSNDDNDAITKAEASAENSDNKLVSSSSTKKERDEQLFHDHSSDLHECNAWNLMCATLNRIVAPVNLLLHRHHPSTVYSSYKSALRKSIPDNYALIHEIHDGQYDTCHLDKDLHASDLRVPLLVGYVASVQCHAHSDWTALMVDEMNSVAKYHGGRGSSSGRGILCWIEERLVKQHANWVRPGAVWMIEGAKLALFSSMDDEEEGDEDKSHNNYTNDSATISTAMIDMSPSTDNSRGGGAIDRMILVGESSLVYAWSPEEASSTFSHQEFSDLMERRCDLGLKGEEVNEEKFAADIISEKSDQKIIEQTAIAENIQIVDADTFNEPKILAEEQVLEACTAGSDKTSYIGSNEEELPQTIEERSKDASHELVDNVSNEYVKKVSSQVTPHEDINAKLPREEQIPRKDDNSTVLVHSEVSRMHQTNEALDYSPQSMTILETSSQPKTSQQMKFYTDTFNDKLGDDFQEGSTSHRTEDAPDHSEKSTAANTAFDDMLDEDSLDYTPLKNDEVGADKLDHKIVQAKDSLDEMLDEDSVNVETPQGKLSFNLSTTGDDSFDDMLDDEDYDDVEAMFQTKNTVSVQQGITVLDEDDLAELGDEDDDDF